MARPTERPRRDQAHPPESPFLPPAPRPQLPPADSSLQQRGVAALALALLSLLAMMLIGNWQRAAAVAGVALAVAATAIVLAISAMSAARRAGTRRPRGALVGVIAGVIGVLLSGIVLLGGTQLSQYVTCMNAASTASQQQACQTQFTNAIRHKFGAPAGS